jgi:S1-C subfamily serine protease
VVHGAEKISATLSDGIRFPAQLAGGDSNADIIPTFDGQAIPNIDRIQKELTEKRLGVKTPITVLRRTDKLDFL